MARIRTIKPETWTDEKIMSLSFPAIVLFIGLWNFTDDQGYHEPSAKTIKSRVLPDRRANVEQLLDEIASHGLIGRYIDDSNGSEWIRVEGFEKHQKVSHPREPRVKQPREIPWRENVSTKPQTPPPPEDSGGLQSPRPLLIGEGKGKDKEGNGMDIAPRETAPRDRNEQWDGLTDVFGYSPIGAEQSLWGRLCKQLVELGATRASIASAAARYRADMPDATLTPPALVKHYQRLMARPMNGKAKPGTAEHTLQLAAAARRRELEEEQA